MNEKINSAEQTLKKGNQESEEQRQLNQAIKKCEVVSEVYPDSQSEFEQDSVI